MQDYPFAADRPNAAYPGPRWLVTERDSCGVGFIATTAGQATHQLIEQALAALGCLEHRGGCSADRDSGDGAGLLTGLPLALFQPWFAERQLPLPEAGALGVGMTFLPQAAELAAQRRAFIEQVVSAAGLNVLGWREVPVRPEVLGLQAREYQPRIEQILVTSDRLRGADLDRVLYTARSRVGKELADDFYICSFSCRTIVYKGMVRSAVLGAFYSDLQNPDFTSEFAVYHRRFSTNTMPKWYLAQPMRLLSHNGEINTLLGNINWMAARELNLAAEGWTAEELEQLTPIVNVQNSDSANLDSVMELLVRTGRSPLEAAMLLVPEAYQNQPDLDDYPEIADFYEYYSGLQEPWDGPAMLVFSDGHTVGATLDRNGLRPARYCITRSGYVVVASEAGVVPLDEAEIVEKGRLGPGQVIAVDLERREILKNWEIKQRIARQHPYGEWVRQFRVNVEPQAFASQPTFDAATLLQQQIAFGYTAEDVDAIVVPMATQAKEPTFCMGDDIPLAVLSNQPRLLYDYFKQRFAQVTNPPIDPLRESLVMSLRMQLGKRSNLLESRPEDDRLLKLETPILNEAELAVVKAAPFGAQELSTLFDFSSGPGGLAAALDRLCQAAAEAVAAGSEILILSDRAAGTERADGGLSDRRTYIPPLLAVGAVHHHLIQQGLRLKASLVVETAQCWSTHHFACLIGYGASAVCPYLALETVRHWWQDEKTQNLMAREKIPALSIEEAQANYRRAVEGGLLKILSKMGISLLSSYHGAQIFEAIGLGAETIDRCFRGTTSRLGGMNLAELAQETIAFHQRAFPLAAKKLANYGFINYKPGGEYHMNSPEMAKALHKAVASRDYDHYEVYRQYLEGRPATALRDLLDFRSDRPSIPLAEVEPVEAIVQRFCTGAMSLGSLSREAHETLAIAMNRLGGKSNSGEGGEDPLRFRTIDDVDAAGRSPTFAHLKGLQEGDTANSAIKQVASPDERPASGNQSRSGRKTGRGRSVTGREGQPLHRHVAPLEAGRAADLAAAPPRHLLD